MADRFAGDKVNADGHKGRAAARVFLPTARRANLEL